MWGQRRFQVAIVDYGMGNLFSVKHACEAAGLQASITNEKAAVMAADAVILPGVGAFGDAMATLNALDLVSPLRDVAATGKPLIGICLGMQLFMTESYEFGRHRGLAIVEGPVVRFDPPGGSTGRLKVPQIGWNRIYRAKGARVLTSREGSDQDPWPDSPLDGLSDGEFMYFVHSFYAKPEDPRLILSLSKYGNVEFCSSLRLGNIFACQFHPERSGPRGLRIYRNIAWLLEKRPEAKEEILG